MLSEKKQEKKHIDDLHFEHKVWDNQLEFYKGELKFFTNRLEEISQRYTDKDILKKLEYFQNQFIIQNDQIDRFQHDIHVHEDALAKLTIDQPVANDRVLVNDHSDHRDRYETFNKLYADLKEEYMVYLRKWM